MSYKLPESLGEDISIFAKLVQEYSQQKIDADQFKAFRVPMGIYEQRQDEVYMSRVRTTGGVITPQQFLDIVEIARRNKSNLLHITTRQEVQIQNLDIENVEAIMLELQKINLATKGGGGNTVRNILVSEFSGISSSELFDVTPYAMALTSKLLAEADSYLMPRKMKIAFSSDHSDTSYAAINDVGFVAKIQDGQKGFLVYAGGGAGAKPTVGWVLFDFIPVSELYVVAEALKKFFYDHGNRKNRNKARLRFVFYKLGEEETIRLIKEYYTEAKKTEVSFVLNDEVGGLLSVYSPKSSIIVNEEQYNQWKNRYAVEQIQKGYSTILLPILLGNISLEDESKVEDLKNLLIFVKHFGEDTIRFTTNQSIRLRNIPNAALPQLFDLVSRLIPDFSVPLLVNNITSCTGADTCRLGIGLSKGLAKAIRDRLLKSNLDLDKLQSAEIHISGCPNSCGQQLWADIGFSGRVLRNDRTYPGYQVYLGAHRGVEPKFAEVIGSISSRDIPEFIHRLLENYISVYSEYTSLTVYLETEGKDFALKLLTEYKTIPSFAEDESYYSDWGAKTEFKVGGRVKAECAAGLFDILEIDSNIIKTTRETLETESNSEKRNRLLYDIIYSASRMLLITRGLEPKTTADTFNFFIKNFIEYGFVDEKFKNVIILARDNKDFDFNTLLSDIYELADRVVELHNSLDDSLQLKDL